MAWCSDPDRLVSRPWWTGVRILMNWCPDPHELVSGPWWTGVQTLMDWCPDLDKLASEPWWAGEQTLMDWCPDPDGLVSGSLWAGVRVLLDWCPDPDELVSAVWILIGCWLVHHLPPSTVCYWEPAQLMVQTDLLEAGEMVWYDILYMDNLMKSARVHSCIRICFVYQIRLAHQYGKTTQLACVCRIAWYVIMYVCAYVLTWAGGVHAVMDIASSVYLGANGDKRIAGVSDLWLFLVVSTTPPKPARYVCVISSCSALYWLPCAYNAICPIHQP